MLSKVCSAAVNGIDAFPVAVEVNAGCADTVIVMTARNTPQRVMGIHGNAGAAGNKICEYAVPLLYDPEQMGRILKPHFLGVLLSLLWLCSCSTTPRSSAVIPETGVPAAVMIVPATQLPAAVTLNREAGRGGHLIVMLCLAGGTNLPFIIDTGSPITCLDQSLEPKLGGRIGDGTFWNFGVAHKAHFYAAPKLYLGSTPLTAGGYILTMDARQAWSSPSQPVMGILGMDCLSHYRIQFDFEAGTMRFLNLSDLTAAELGEAIPLTFTITGQDFPEESVFRPVIHKRNLIGEKGEDLMVDTGFPNDGGLVSALFQRETQVERLRLKNEGVQLHGDKDVVWIPQCSWNGQTYTNLLVGDGGPNQLNGDGGDLIGLRFLARHLVTFDFPERTMYLKQRTIGPLAGDKLLQDEASLAEAANSAAKFLSSLLEKGQLPGMSAHGHGHFDGNVSLPITYPESETFNIRKNGDSSRYHYQLTRATKDSPWKLEKAWRTDPTGRKVQEYPINR